MKKWQKKIIVLSVIWIVGGVALFAAVSMLFCNVIFSGVYADFGKYVDVAKRLENPEDYVNDEKKLKAAICLRAALCDERISERGCEYLASHMYVDKDGVIPFSYGDWCAVAKKAEDEEEVNFIKDSFALVNFKKLVDAGLGGKVIYDEVARDEKVNVRIDKYWQDGLIVYPSEISFVDAVGNVTDTIECSKDVDVSDLEEVAADDVYMQTTNCLEMYENYLRGELVARTEAENVAKTVDVTKEGNTGKKTLLPWMTRYISVYVKDGYAMIGVQEIRMPQAIIIGSVAFAVWTVVFGIIGAVIFFRSDK